MGLYGLDAYGVTGAPVQLSTERKESTMTTVNAYGIETYADLARFAGSIILCNEMGNRDLEMVSGELDEGDELFQFYIVSDATFLIEHTDEPVFYDPELDLHVWGITHFGTAWDYVPAPEIRD